MDLMQYNFKDAKLWNMYVKIQNTKKGDMKISFTIPEEAKPIIKDGWGVMESLILVINTLILIFVTM